jgi:NitT/TauT family transport system substrate-binding protein
VAVVGLVALAGCGIGDVQPTPSPVATVVPELRKVKLALGYIPNVQFAPYYVAKAKGYYEAEGLDVEFEHGVVPELITLLGAGDQGVNFAAASGDEIIQARVQGVPVKYVMTWYRQYPVAAAADGGADGRLSTPADLRGKTIGVPGPFGATYVGLKALLKAGGLTESDIKMETIGFTQVETLLNKRADAVMVYAANEPVQLRKSGMNVSTLLVSDYVRLASNGLVTNDQTIESDPELVGKMVRATLRGIQDTIANPQAAFDAALTMLPEVGGTDTELQKEVLLETVKLMQAKPDDPAANQPMGWIDRDVWASTQEFLLDAKLIPQKGNVEEMFTNDFIQQ